MIASSHTLGINPIPTQAAAFSLLNRSRFGRVLQNAATDIYLACI
jgi:hypothetical protein